jgi:hypothetical protein
MEIICCAAADETNGIDDEISQGVKINRNL